MQTALKWLLLAVKGLSLVSGISAYYAYIPEKYLPIATLAFMVASAVREGLILIGDMLDDGIKNDSFK